MIRLFQIVFVWDVGYHRAYRNGGLYQTLFSSSCHCMHNIVADSFLKLFGSKK